ncbi:MULTISPECIES: ABC transporter substrate-binding protein [Clostridium]|jgi:lactose/L-arabinose transport system substrate-binding protein|uniref:ABC transporter substrate-binding protein n=1 Tax=Clostridium TaxID=1485 RepID=UPI001596AEA7|nr:MULTISPECIES: extracellular solute-binding protein [Clostridium]MBS5308578.1 extracellular solute-binding protein [Clostridium sp.]MBS6503135.1 extracellular solute-binding protein [Clostridium sp.]MDB1940526.1 extracellular solute-binding protein [Clostridium tertium]MDB1971155.1 extracellular solute-binding protein [Clostridium tertium]MDU7950266.1 extracellular solute-binding protein [Clostridium sp.]
MKIKKLLSTIMAFTMATTVLVGCSNKAKEEPNANGGEKKLVAWCWDQSFNGAALKIAEELYKKDNSDFTLEIVDMSKIDLEQKLNTNLVSGVTTGLPDIILANDINIAKYINSYDGAFTDLSGTIKFDEFSKYKVDSVTVNGKQYAIPFDIGSAGMFYRRDYLEQAGFKPEDLQNITWEKYIEIGKVVKEKTGKDMITVNPNEDTLIPIIMNSAGSWFTTEDNKANFVGNKALEESLKVFKELSTSGIAKPVTGWSEFVGSFNNGDVATVISAVWQIPTIMDAKDQSGKWGVAPIPRLSNIEGAKNASNEGGSSWMVLESSKSKDLAIDFLSKTIGGSSDFYSEFLTNNGGVGSYTKAFESEAYSKEIEFFGGEKVYQIFSEWSKEVPGITVGMYTQEAKDALKTEFSNIVNGGDINKSLEAMQNLFEQQVQ